MSGGPKARSLDGEIASRTSLTTPAFASQGLCNLNDLEVLVRSAFSVKETSWYRTEDSTSSFHQYRVFGCLITCSVRERLKGLETKCTVTIDR